MKTLAKLLVVLIIVFIVAAVVLSFYVNSIARTAVEKGGTYALGVNTTLKGASIQPLAGGFSMSGLNVANPDGYDSSHFLTLGAGDVAVSLGTLMDDTVKLPHLKLADIDMHLEKKDGKANYQAIMDNLKKLSSDKPADPDAKKFTIETVDIRNVMVHVNMMGQNIDVPIEAITLKNVGSGGEGVDLAQLSGVIVKSVFAAVAQNAGNLIPAEMLGDLTKGLEGLADLDKLAQIADVKAVGELAGKAAEQAGKAAEQAGKAAEEIGAKAGDLTNKAKEGLGGLLGDDKDKKDK
jgi:uncharacterized protein involved in outer membrane biogenesis